MADKQHKMQRKCKQHCLILSKAHATGVSQSLSISTQIINNLKENQITNDCKLVSIFVIPNTYGSGIGLSLRMHIRESGEEGRGEGHAGVCG